MTIKAYVYDIRGRPVKVWGDQRHWGLEDEIATEVAFNILLRHLKVSLRIERAVELPDRYFIQEDK